MKKAILPWTKPSFIYSTTASYALAIMGGDARCQDWIYSHYVNLHVGDVKQFAINPTQYFNINVLQATAPDAWGAIPLLTYQTLQKEALNLTRDNLFEYMLSMLEQGKYIFTYVNFKGFTHKHDYPHNILIHGIDLDEKKVYVIAFKERLYDSCDIDLTVFCDMFFFECKNDVQKKLLLIHRNALQYSWNPVVLKIQLEDYVSSRFSLDCFDLYYHKIEKTEHSDENNYYNFIFSAFQNGGFTFGLEAHEILGGYLRYFIAEKSNSNDPWFDLRSFRCWMEHKILMYERWKYIGRIGKDVLSSAGLVQITNNAECRAQEAKAVFKALIKMSVLSCYQPSKLQKIENKIMRLNDEEAIDLEAALKNSEIWEV